MGNKHDKADWGLIARIVDARGAIFMFIITIALLFFELFNFTTTKYAIADLVGPVVAGPLLWATILAVAFCAMDFAGIARIFTPEEGRDEPIEIWYLFGAWLVAALVNTYFTWWSIHLRIIEAGTTTDPNSLRNVPIIFALAVLASRVLIIQTFSVRGERFLSEFKEPEQRTAKTTKPSYSMSRPSTTSERSSTNARNYPPTQPYRPAPGYSGRFTESDNDDDKDGGK